MRRRTLLSGLAAVGSLPALSWAQEEFGVDLSADIVIVGGGAAGLSAAISAAETARKLNKRLKIVLFEKNADLGGDTLIAGGYFNAVDPKRQNKLHIQDSVELFESQILQNAGGAGSPELAHELAAGATEALYWLESYGVVFLPEVYTVFGSLYPRAHKPILPSGLGYIRALAQAAISMGVEIRTNCAAQEILTANGVLRGVTFTAGQGRRICSTHAVILASGGFGANSDMIARYAPSLMHLPIDTQPGSTGDMHQAAAAIGAQLVNMQYVECIPGAGNDVNFPVRLDYIPAKMILVTDNGRRFVDEDSGRYDVATAIVANGESQRVWAIADQSLVDALDATLQKNIYRGLYAAAAWREPTLMELAKRIGVDTAGLMQTMQQSPAKDRIRHAPFWAVPVHLRIHATLGGIQISEKAEVLNTQGHVIAGLWAAGAVTGGIHGRNRIGGNGINTAVVFGRIAGRNAVESGVFFTPN